MVEKKYEERGTAKSWTTFEELRGSKNNTNFTMDQSDKSCGKRCEECFRKQYCRQKEKMIKTTSSETELSRKYFWHNSLAHSVE